MVLNNPEVLIKMKADIGMKDPPTVAVFNVHDVPLKGEHFLTSGAFILIAYRKKGGWGGTKRPSAALPLTSSSCAFVKRRPACTCRGSWTSHAKTCTTTVRRMLSGSATAQFLLALLTREIYGTGKIVYLTHWLLGILIMCRGAISSLQTIMIIRR